MSSLLIMKVQSDAASRKNSKKIDLKKDKVYHTNIVTAGDYIDFEINNNGTGVINKIDKRKIISQEKLHG